MTSVPETSDSDARDGTRDSVEPVLSMKDLRVAYRVGRKRMVRPVDGVSLDIHAGEIVGLIGESGSGKSTIGRAVTALAPIESGQLRVGRHVLRPGKPRNRHELAKTVQMIFQNPHGSLDPRRRISSSILEPLQVQSLGTPAERREMVDGILPLVGLNPEHAERYPHELSGGQKQRVGIARAVLTEPELIVCDEVVSALDVSLQAAIINLLMEMRTRLNLTLLFITHDIGVVGHMADRIAVMYFGQLVEIGPALDVLGTPRHPYTSGLIASRPQIGTSIEGTDAESPVRGETPSLLNPPTGCRFATRCPYAEEKCFTEAPPLTQVGRTRARCHFADKLNLAGDKDAKAAIAN